MGARSVWRTLSCTARVAVDRARRRVVSALAEREGSLCSLHGLTSPDMASVEMSRRFGRALPEEAVGEFVLVVGGEGHHGDVVDPEVGEVLQIVGDDVGGATQP